MLLQCGDVSGRWFNRSKPNDVWEVLQFLSQVDCQRWGGQNLCRHVMYLTPHSVGSNDAITLVRHFAKPPNIDSL